MSKVLQLPVYDNYHMINIMVTSVVYPPTNHITK